MFIKF